MTTTMPSVTITPTATSPMLAKPFDPKLIRGNGFFQPKLDGVRLIWTGKEALSRTGKPILGVPGILDLLHAHFRGFPLDGELYCHEKTFQNVVGKIKRTKNVEDDVSIGYHVYDMPVARTFRVRYHMLCESVTRSEVQAHPAAKRLLLVPTNFAPNVTPELARAYEKQYVDQGYEGGMFRTEMGVYRFGKRSSDLIKIKSFEEDEFSIVGKVPLYSYEKVIVPAGTPGAKQYADGSWYKNGEATQHELLGALVCETADGVRFEVGSGFTDAARQALWEQELTGERVTVKFFELTDPATDGADGRARGRVPRHPVFKGLRDYE